MELTPKIAFLATNRVGEGLIFLVIANNLARNGYTVTFYSDSMFELRNWLLNITVKPYPALESLDEMFVEFDLVFAANGSPITESCSKECYPELAKKYVFISYSSSMPESLIFDHSKKLTAGAEKLIKLARASGSCLVKFGTKSSLAERAANFCKERLGLHGVINSCGLVASDGLTHRKHSNRVIIHPASNSPDRIWPAYKFNKLAKLLAAKDWDPVFCISPGERKTWAQRLDNQYLISPFETLSEVAGYIYESGFMIGNDSGMGHLASALLIPTLTISWRSSKFMRWRPGWAPGKVITPGYKILPKSYRLKYWHRFISVRKIFREFKSLVIQSHSSYNS